MATTVLGYVTFTEDARTHNVTVNVRVPSHDAAGAVKKSKVLFPFEQSIKNEFKALFVGIELVVVLLCVIFTECRECFLCRHRYSSLPAPSSSGTIAASLRVHLSTLS